MCSAYKDFISLVDIPDIPQEKKRVKDYWRIICLLKTMAICCLIFVLLSTVVFTDLKKLSFMFTAAVVAVYYCYRRIWAKRFRDVLLQECDPVKMVTLYGTLISYARRQSSWELHFYNLASALYYAGKMEDVKKVQSLLMKYCPNNLGKLYYEMIGADLAVYYNNMEEIEHHCANMLQVRSSVKLQGMMNSFYIARLQYLDLVQMSKNGCYQGLYDSIKSSVSIQGGLLQEVKRHYYLHNIALLLGDAEKAEQHKNFVLQNGGTLWYRFELEQQAVR